MIHKSPSCRFDNVEKPLLLNNETKSGENSYNVTLSAQINKSDIEDDSELSCLVRIPNTEYERREAITYDGMINLWCLTHISNFYLFNSAENVSLMASFF